jgi:hypothetical protein
METHGVKSRRRSGSLTITSGQNGIDGLRDLLAWIGVSNPNEPGWRHDARHRRLAGSAAVSASAVSAWIASWISRSKTACRLATPRQADAFVAESMCDHVLRLIDIAKINNDRARHRTLQAVQIQCAGLLPLGHDYQCVGACFDLGVADELSLYLSLALG